MVINKKWFTIFISLFLCVFSSLSLAGNHLPADSKVPGGIAVIYLPVSSKAAPKVTFKNKRVMVVPHQTHPQRWIAVVGIKLTLKPGKYKIVIKTPNKTLSQNFMIKNKKYRNSFIYFGKAKRNYKIYKPGKPKPLTKKQKLFLAKIKKQQAHINGLMAQWTDKKNINMDFLIPVNNKVTSEFGTQRIINGVKRSRHKGLDLRGKHGTPIRSPANGRVIDTGRYYFTGNTVFVDHGQGLITLYAHMTRIKVKKGQLVDKGSVLGTVGSTGRASGPHLHWGVSLNGVRIDPILFIQ